MFVLLVMSCTLTRGESGIVWGIMFFSAIPSSAMMPCIHKVFTMFKHKQRNLEWKTMTITVWKLQMICKENTGTDNACRKKNTEHKFTLSKLYFTYKTEGWWTDILTRPLGNKWTRDTVSLPTSTVVLNTFMLFEGKAATVNNS